MTNTEIETKFKILETELSRKGKVKRSKAKVKIRKERHLGNSRCLKTFTHLLSSLEIKFSGIN